MEAVIFVGIQGVGKSTFFKHKFFDTHIRLNGDMLKTRHRENVLLKACFEARQKFVLDKMNLLTEQRAEYISEAKSFGFRVIGYYFPATLQKAMERNNRREGKARVPEKAIQSSFTRLQIPRLEEGFDELFYVRIEENEEFVIEARKDFV
jgi:predicted kinase